MFQSNTLAEGLNHEYFRDGLALGVGSTGDTALGLDNCLAVVKDAIFAGKFLARTVCNLSSFLVCCLRNILDWNGNNFDFVRIICLRVCKVYWVFLIWLDYCVSLIPYDKVSLSFDKTYI